ncbi:MAG TPA: lipid A deacylase LpxR family protein [Marinobacter sp.]|uniref:Lipid A deacylase LpxR family protein n=2 Tax=root TaxID=1 RepID=A0A831VZ91_9GAMM|nr:lipid A deacylase LpxR family protein [Marinobacter antarcticus]HDZ36755.1 lipid A deacylase LpxR family protein [Marinobacter sp.]HEA53416.1 lipid A deacylase LpxR family protein [Marinobacter antarcticus]
MSRRCECAFLLSFAMSVFPTSLKAEVVNLSWDNDLLTGTDRGYTNGVRLSYLTDTADENDGKPARFARVLRDELHFLPGIGTADSKQAVSLSLRQLMVTPEDITVEGPQFDDIPYAGHLSLSGTLWSWNADTITGFGAHIGVIGPESGAESVQKWVHKATGSDKSQGWGNQLGTDVVGGIQAAHGRKLLQLGQGGNIEQRVSVIGSGLLSSFRTSAKTGLVWQLGRHLPINFVPDYAGTSSTIALPGSFKDWGSSWSVYVGLGVEYVGYSYIDDNAGAYRFDEGPLIGRLGLGATWQWDHLLAAVTLRASTSEDERHKDNFSFGTLSVSWAI